MKLIDKNSLVEKIKEWTNLLMNEINRKGTSQTDKLFLGGRIVELQAVKVFLDTFSVKEMDLEKECDNWRHNHFHGRRDKEASGEYLERSSQLDLAKHFFKLGLKAQKGE